MGTRDFQNAFELEARHLVRLAQAGQLSPVWERDDLARHVAATLASGKSVLLVGESSVGKTAVVHRMAQLMAAEELPSTPLAGFSTTQIMSGTSFLGEWQSKVSGLAKEAVARGATLVITDVGNLASAGRSSVSNGSMFDALRPQLETGELTMLGEVTPHQLALLAQTPGFAELFQQIAVEPLDNKAVDRVVQASAEHHGISVDAPARASLVQLTTRFLAGRPQPAPALDLLRQVADYQEQKASINEHEPIDPAFIERVFTIYSGLPSFVVSQNVSRKASEVRSWFEQRLVGQTEAIDAVVQSIALFKAGLQDPKRPLGSFLFVGPTGVGKTELARALATYLYGSPNRLLRFDLSELKDYHAFEQLLGSAQRPEQPARLVDPVRKQPFQVVLFDELEKAHPNVWDTLLALLDEGRLTTPRGELIDFRSTFIIATSNVGAEEADRQVGFGTSEASEARKQRMARALETTFRPEFLGRFQHVVHFQPLSREHVLRIARHELREVLARDGITSRNLVVDIDDEALDLVLQRGFDARWGARGLKRELQRQLVMPLALTLMEHRVAPGQVLKVSGRDGRIRVRRLDTAVSRTWVQEQAPIRLAGRSWSRADLADALRNMRGAMEQLSLEADEAFIEEEQQRLQDLRREHEFWQDPEQAARDLRDLDRATLVLDRLDRLRSRLDAFEIDLGRADTRPRIEALTERVEQVETSIRGAFREVVYMGRDGYWDALLEVRPVGTDPIARDFLVRLYTSWAEHIGMSVSWLRDPLHEDEPALLAVKGPYAAGLLALEAGLHRVRDDNESGVCRVTVAPWTDRRKPVSFHEHRALKAIGRYDGKVRSRLVCEHDLVLQNGNVLAENRELAVEVVGSWAQRPPPSDGIVRRYDLSTPLVRDVLTGLSTGRPDAVSPERFHQLLCQRVETSSEGPTAA